MHCLDALLVTAPAWAYLRGSSAPCWTVAPGSSTIASVFCNELELSVGNVYL